MAKVQRLHQRSFTIPNTIFFALLLAVIVIHVWLNRLFELRTHVALGYGSVYSTNMVFELFTRYGGALVYALLAWLAVRPFRNLLPNIAARLLRVAAMGLGWLIGYGMWSLDPVSWLLFFHHQSFSRVDPIFHLDMSFYVYVLPQLMGIVGRLIATLILFTIIRVVYVVIMLAEQHQITSKPNLPQMILRQARLIFAIATLVMLGFDALAVLGRYALMLSASNNSFVFGPDFVTAKLAIPVFFWIHLAALLLLTLAIAWLFVKPTVLLPLKDGFIGISRLGFKRPIYAFGLYVVTMVLTAITGGLVNSLYVHPNQNTVELPYIADTISATRWAMGIEHVNTTPFVPNQSLTSAGVARDENALQNVRVNDQGQTTSIYNQLQSFKSYFTFTNTSVDRYGGYETYVSARQMDNTKLPVPTWINQTLVYTHGYGLAASPVNQFDQDGLPVMWAKDTPQKTQAPIPAITRPQIYFGTMQNTVIAPSKQPEFDYPVGSTDETSHYAGGYGLPIQGNRLLLALEERSLKFYTSDQLLPTSQWLFDRDIYQRVQDIAPFLHYDNDAFPFIDGQGHIKWLLDAYTESSDIPYAQSYMGTDYIRNSVKVVMDAYTGKTTFYVVDPSDPMLQSFMKVYPQLFTTQIPADIAAHFRYPRDLFQTQAAALTRYHMTDPSVFFNQDDQWDLASQIYNQNQTIVRPAVYQMIRMPDRTNPSFVLSELFTPHGKNNLNGWLIADNEPGSYGKLTLYQFPQSNVIFGPMMAENQIDSNPEISSQLTLWNQQGSHVVRGDLLLIPVGDALLYVEPVYLVANRENSLPQLERVIIDFNKQVYIDTSLGAAISDLIAGQTGTQPAQNTPGTIQGGGTVSGNGNVASLTAQANQLFAQYESDTAKGDFEAAGKDLKQLGTILNQLTQLTNKTAK